MWYVRKLATVQTPVEDYLFATKYGLSIISSALEHLVGAALLGKPEEKRAFVQALLALDQQHISAHLTLRLIQ